jgi:hypothetical protein
MLGLGHRRANSSGVALTATSLPGTENSAEREQPDGIEQDDTTSCMKMQPAIEF